MEKERILIEKLKEKEPEEVSRYELDSEKGIDVVLKTAPDTKLSEEGQAFKYEPIEIILEQKGKNILDFKEFLPKNYKIVLVDKGTEKQEKKSTGNTQNVWEHDPVAKFIVVPREWDEKSKDILGLLHEIGHSLDKDIFAKNYHASYWFNIASKIEESKTKENNQNELLKKAKKQYLKLRSGMERYAWAKALVLARRLKKETEIDLLKPFQGKTAAETRENLEKYIHGIYSLGASEKWYFGSKSFGKEFKGIFTTKFYKGEKFTPEYKKKIRGRK